MPIVTSTSPRLSAFLSGGGVLSADGTNVGCHGNVDGVEPNEKAIIAHVRVFLLVWGKFYDDHPDALDYGYKLCRDLVTGPFLNGLAQYGVGRGSIVGSGRIVDNKPPATLNEDEARDWLKAQIKTLPIQPTVDETSLLYVLLLPPATKPTISTGKDDFCGYHQSAKIHDNSQNNDLFWALIRTDKADQSSGKALINSVSDCVSHEIAEALTSRDGRGYHKGNCEIGDLCEQTGGFEYRGWHVEQYWSQWDHTCINGDLPVSLKRFLQASNHPIGAGLRTLSRSSINVEYIASQFR